MRIDAYTHFFPKKFFDKMQDVAGDYKDMGKRVRSLPALFDLEPQLVESDYAGAFAATIARFRRRALLVLLTELAEEAVELQGDLPLGSPGSGGRESLQRGVACRREGCGPERVGRRVLEGVGRRLRHHEVFRRVDRRRVLVSAHAVARWLDVRTGYAPVHGEVVMAKPQVQFLFDFGDASGSGKSNVTASANLGAASALARGTPF